MIDFSNYPRFTKFKGKSILAVDYGFKVIGTAIYKVGFDPYPLSFDKIIYKSDEDAFKKLKNYIENESIDIVVFGLPFYVDGKESEMTKKLKLVGENFKDQISNLPFYFQDETLTTETAKNRMMNSPEYNFKVDLTKIDCLSASIILEDFMREAD
jgi:putative Holliday junction resolvase